LICVSIIPFVHHSSVPLFHHSKQSTGLRGSPILIDCPVGW
jgi:hypothetical protein